MSNNQSYPSDYRLIFLHTDYPHCPVVLHDMIASREVLYLKLPAHITDVNRALDYITVADNHCLDYADVLVIDEADNFPESYLIAVLQMILHDYACDILVVTRNLPLQSIADDAFDQPPRIITGTDVYPVVHQTGDLIVEAIAFGRGTVRVNRQDIALPVGDILHQLFFFVLENPLVTRDEILVHFWSHLTIKSAVANFHVSRQHLNQLLGFELLQVDSSYYRLNPELTILYDVEFYRQLLQQVTFQNQSNHTDQYRDAYHLYHHDYLMTSHVPWVQRVRNELRLMQADVCYHLAQTRLPSPAALGLLSQGFRYNPYREDIVQTMMSIYMTAGMPCDAAVVYDVLVANLQARNNIAPQQSLTNLANRAKDKCNT